MVKANDKKISLCELYKAFDTPVDRLACRPEKLGEFAAEITRRGFQLSPEQLLANLFTLRKSGQLPRLRRPGKALLPRSL